jgi:hypothetical protein
MAEFLSLFVRYQYKRTKGELQEGAQRIFGRTVTKPPEVELLMYNPRYDGGRFTPNHPSARHSHFWAPA